MSLTNHDRIGKVLELLRQGLTPFVERELQAAFGDNWTVQAAQSLRRDPDFQEGGPGSFLDVHALLILMWGNWSEVFRNTLGHAERSLVSELREVRNRWAHQQPFSIDDTYRALDSAARLLTAVSAPEAREVERQKQELLRLRFEEEARRESRKAALAPVEGQPSGGLRPWREIVTPHPDVASGRYQQAEFAADLAAVYEDPEHTAGEYSDPREFFQRTYLTEGLQHLLRTALLRIGTQGGDPVVELQTNFGGGKTHSMLALYHLFSERPASDLPGIEGVLNAVGLVSIPPARRAVLVGTALSPGQARSHPDGTLVYTMWGELAWQLGGAEGYALVADADRHGVSPGSSVLRELFTQYGPCLILIDEWVAFVRQLYGKDHLPAGSFDANLSFAQALTEAVKIVPGALLVASLPASDIEIGGEGGREALARLKNTFGRIESSWRPATTEEGFEIVRRRLFQPIADPGAFTARDAVVGAFARLYRDQAQEFPNGCREADYERRLKAAYPIHPELFDKLYIEWSSLDKFQRTRGVLRLMAAVIHGLWEREDRSLMILPAGVPVDDPPVFFELTRHMEDNWAPIIEKDVDGPSSLPLALDLENPNLGRYSACRRVARTIYIGSAPTAKGKNPGLDERSIHLGCVQPGESVATFGDALRRLTDNAVHLYVDRNRYWFNTQPSVTRLAQDRAAQLDVELAWDELKSRLRSDRQRGDLAGVHAAPASSNDVPDDQSVRLVVLGPYFSHANRDSASPARQECARILAGRGNGPRLHQNMLAFLAPDRNRLAELELGLRQYLAWKSIVDEQDKGLNLDAFQRHQAQTKLEQAGQTVAARIKETYVWLIAPSQSDPRNPETLELIEYKLQPVQTESPFVLSSRKLRNDELLITQFSGSRLRMEMDRYNLWQAGDHVNVKQLWTYFSRYPYLARLKDAAVLLDAVRQGVGQITWQETFAYAEAWDADKQRYRGLKVGQQGINVLLDDYSVVVRPEAAIRQLDREREEAEARKAVVERVEPATVTPAVEPGNGGGHVPLKPVQPVPIRPPTQKKLRRFYGNVTLDPLRIGRDAAAIAEAIVTYLSNAPGATVRISLEIEADLPEGASEELRRTVTENARTLKFKSAEFEEG